VIAESVFISGIFSAFFFLTAVSGFITGDFSILFPVASSSVVNSGTFSVTFSATRGGGFNFRVANISMLISAFR